MIIVLLIIAVLLLRHVHVIMFLCVCKSTFEVWEQLVREIHHLVGWTSSIHNLRIEYLLRVGHGRNMIGMSDHLDVYRIMLIFLFHLFVD